MRVKKRSRLEPEYELLDTGIFDKNEYFDISMEYAKGDEQDILIKVTVENRSKWPHPLPFCLPFGIEILGAGDMIITNTNRF